MNTSVLKIAALLLCLLAPLAWGQEASQSTVRDGSVPVEWRQHFESIDEKSHARYRITEITRLPNQTLNETFILIEDVQGHERLQVKHTINFFDHVATLEITDLDTKETAEASSPLGYKSITRAGAIDEIRKDPALRRARIPEITLTVNGVQETASEDEWSSSVIRDKRSALRKAASPQFLERLERLRSVGTSDSPVFQVCGGVLKYLLYNETCKSPDVHTKIAAPDCAFDSSFRFECSKKSKDRIAAAREKGEKIERY